MELLELAAVFFRPALYHYFFLSIELDGVAALAVHDAEETVFPAAEGEISHGSGHTDVDTDVPGRGLVAEAAGGGAAGSEEGCLVAEGACVQEFHGFVEILGVGHAEDGTEDFGVGQVTGGGDVVEDSGFNEVTIFEFGNLRTASVEENFGALLFAQADQRFNAVLTLLGDDGAHLHAVFETVANLNARCGMGNRVAEGLLGF